MKRFLLFICMIIFIIVFNGKVDVNVLAMCISILLLGIFSGDTYYSINDDRDGE